MSHWRFSRWDGSQDPLPDKADVGGLVDELAEDMLGGQGIGQALERLQRRGFPGRFAGLDEMLRRVAEQRRAAARQLNLTGPLDEAKAQLDDIVELERHELAGRQDESARIKETTLDLLPAGPAGKIRELQSYDFASAEAAERFTALVEDLKRAVLDAHFRSLTGAMSSFTEDDLARVKEMLAELNSLIARRAGGEDYDFEGFMERYGDFFPEKPNDLDELLATLARRAAAMTRLLAALDPEQRRELEDLSAGLLGDLDLAWELDSLARTLQSMGAGGRGTDPLDGMGIEPMNLAQVVDTIERIGEHEQLEQALAADYPGASLEDIDPEDLRAALGDEAARDLERLEEIERALAESGVVKRDGRRLELTARGARLIGERALAGVLEKIRKEPTHRTGGTSSEPTGQTRPWTFGDEEEISVQRTVYNALTRAGARTPVRLEQDDFEVVETESRPRTATALLLDLSFSMPLRGHWVPAKRMALALDALISGRYPQDSLYLVGFSDYARKLQPAELAMLDWERVHGTNMEHAFLLARRLLTRDPRSIKQIIMVTDGEPTAHLERGYALFNWPPLPETIRATLREAARLRRCQIAVNVFMLEETHGLVAFMERLSRVTGGSVCHHLSGDLSSAVVGGYLSDRPP